MKLYDRWLADPTGRTMSEFVADARRAAWEARARRKTYPELQRQQQQIQQMMLAHMQVALAPRVYHGGHSNGWGMLGGLLG